MKWQIAIEWCLGNAFTAAGNMRTSLTEEFAQPSVPLKYQNKQQNKWKNEILFLQLKFELFYDLNQFL